MWKVDSAIFNTKEYKKLLKDGWEPFAVGDDNFQRFQRVWFRRQGKEEIKLPPPSQGEIIYTS